MALRQITVMPDGGMVALHSRQPDSLNLLKSGIGKAEVERTTDIKYDSDLELWYAVFLVGEFAGLRMSVSHAMRADLLLSSLHVADTGYGFTTLYFADEQRCIQAEHRVVDALRLKGYVL